MQINEKVVYRSFDVKDITQLVIFNRHLVVKCSTYSKSIPVALDFTDTVDISKIDIIHGCEGSGSNNGIIYRQTIRCRNNIFCCCQKMEKRSISFSIFCHNQYTQESIKCNFLYYLCFVVFSNLRVTAMTFS